MSISPGTRLGAFEIVSLVGAGGMGEVYRARDTRLDRAVAIKVLPPAFAADASLRERFDREARAISSLNHPHVCSLFDVGHTDGVDFLVLEYLDGETLAERLARGALPLEQGLRIATEIADALAAAHRAGVIHRDLKPANVMLTKAGAGSTSSSQAKLLDFGLAKPAAPVVATSGLSMLPTTPPGITAQGTILGTFQYMAPEQIEGLEADARTDVFAFGAVLFEMLTGRPAFEGKTRASLLGAILKDEPPRVSTVQPISPPALDRIVATCLAKDPDDRYQSARDLLRDLKWASSSEARSPAVAATDRSRRRYLPWLAASLATIGFIAASIMAVRHVREAPPAAEPIQFSVGPPPNTTFATPPGGGTGLATQLAVSPDGRFVVFVGSSAAGYQLWLRPLGGLDARAIAGSEEGAFPFWSPDSRQIAFFAGGKLKKVSIAGGPPIVLCDALTGRGGTWNRDNVIVFAPSTGGTLQRVSGAGGIPQPASILDTQYGETSHRFPSFLPDGRHFLYSGTIGTCCPASKPARVRVGSLDSMDATTLLQVESSAAVASGHLLFNRDFTLMAQPFDATSMRFAGDAFPIAERVANEGSRYASFSVSPSGVLVYARGIGRPTMRLTWFDRSGRTLGTLGDPATYLGLSLSSDDKRVAVSVATSAPENRDIWILDAIRGTSTRFTFDPGDDNAPLWSPDDSRIVFQGNRDGSSTMRMKRVEGTTNEETVAAFGTSGAALPWDWSRDGRYVLFTRTQAFGGTADIWMLPFFGDRKPQPLVQSPATEVAPVFAPDGRWFAYQSNEIGSQSQVYVQPFPPTGGKFQVSKSGGTQPVWRQDGTELYFISPDSQLMAAPVELRGQFRADLPTALFRVGVVLQGANGRQFAITRDGRRFLVNLSQQQVTAIPLTVVVNWLAAVQK